MEPDIQLVIDKYWWTWTVRDRFRDSSWPDNKEGNRKIIRSKHNGSEMVETFCMGADQSYPSVGLHLQCCQCGQTVFVSLWQSIQRQTAVWMSQGWASHRGKERRI